MDEEIRAAHKARLHEIDLRIAKLGYDTPPELITERQEILRHLRADGSSSPVRAMETPTLDDLFMMIVQTNERTNRTARVGDMRQLTVEHQIRKFRIWLHILTGVLLGIALVLALYLAFVAGKAL